MQELEGFQVSEQSGGCRGELEWLGRGLVQPLYRLDFYRQAIRRRVLPATLFFALFGVALALLATIYIVREMSTASQEIQEAFAQGEFPRIVIEDGIANVDATQPFVLSDDAGGFLVIDTTGIYEEIDRSRHAQGILLRRDELHILNNREYQIFALSDLHDFFGLNPIVLDEQNVVRLWQGLSGIVGVLVLIGLGLWNVVAWFMFMCFLAVIVWGIASMLKWRGDFRQALISGLYAYVPASYLHLVLWLVTVRFFGLKTILLLTIWVYVLYRLSREPRSGGPMVLEESSVP